MQGPVKSVIAGIASGVVTFFVSIQAMGYTSAFVMPPGASLAAWDALVILGLGATLVALVIHLVALRMSRAAAPWPWPRSLQRPSSQWRLPVCLASVQRCLPRGFSARSWHRWLIASDGPTRRSSRRHFAKRLDSRVWRLRGLAPRPGYRWLPA